MILTRKASKGLYGPRRGRPAASHRSGGVPVVIVLSAHRHVDQWPPRLSSAVVIPSHVLSRLM
jgi:hypothetical protein